MKESQQIEFKRQWKDEWLKWVSAFANAEGGVLMVGYDDHGQVVGVEQASKLLEDIPNKIRDILGIVVDVNLKVADGLETLHIQVPAYPYPVSYKGEYHYRSGSTKQELKGAALDRFLLRKQGLHWDAVPLPGLEVNSLDTATFKKFSELAISSQRLPASIANDSPQLLLERLRLTQNHYLKRAVALLFHPDPERFVTGACIKIGAFGVNDADLLHHDEVVGNLFTQIENTIEVLKLKYLRALISYDELYRKESYPVPLAALREALLNAVVHKDYASATAIQISVYPDKLMIWNPGHLPESWTLDKLMSKHASCPFNPDIANTFFRAGLIESWGRGIERIIDTCKQGNYPAPKWQLELGGLWVVFEFPRAHVRQLPDETGQATGQVAGQAEAWVLEVLQVCSRSELTRSQIQEVAGIKHRETFQNNYLNPLLADGLIERTIPDKPTSPKQKYRITVAGIRFLNNK